LITGDRVDLTAYDRPLNRPVSDRPLNRRSIEPARDPFPIKLGSETAASLGRWRRRAGLTQTQLAREVGVGRSFIGKLERGQQAPGVATAARICAALQLDADEAARLVAEAVTAS
jgi:DNA-binding XRE family transcriptional regulator